MQCRELFLIDLYLLNSRSVYLNIYLLLKMFPLRIHDVKEMFDTGNMPLYAKIYPYIGDAALCVAIQELPRINRQLTIIINHL